MRRYAFYVACLTLLGPAAEGATDQFLKAQALRGAAAEAAAAGDHAGAVRDLTEALKLRPGHPSVLLALASAEAEIGDGENAMTHLQQVATMGIAVRIAERPEFLDLQLKPRFIGAIVQMDMNFDPVGAPEAAATLGDGAALFEGVAVDGPRLFAGSVRERRIVVVENGAARDFVAAGTGGLWSVFGLAVDTPRHLLWAASAAGPLTAGLEPGERGAAGVFAFDLTTGALKRKAVLPPDIKASLGDIAVAADGTVYASDSANAALWRLAPTSEALERVFDDKRFVSPQGLALSGDGRTLIVADYAMGLYAIDLARGRMSSVSIPSGITLLGIDGLALAGDGRLIATQNGISPERVVALEIDADVTMVRRMRVLAANSPLHGDITLSAVDGDQLFYIANSQWGRFDETGAVKDAGPFAPTIVATIPLTAR